MDATRVFEAVGEAIFEEPEEGVDRREASVTRSRAVAALDLEMLEEGEHEFRIDPLHRDGGRLETAGGEDDEQLEAGRVGLAGVRTGAPVARQVLAEKSGEVGAEQGHHGSPTCRASPATAIPAISVGVACRYQ